MAARHTPSAQHRPARRHLAGAILTVVTIVATAGPTMAAGLAAAPGSFQGRLEVTIAEGDGFSRTDYTLQTRAERLTLRFAGEAPAGFVTGATVRLSGRRDGQTVAALDGVNGGQVLQSAPGWSGARRIAVILMNFADDASRPYTRAQASGVVFGNTRSARSYYAEQSHGAVSLQGQTFDWVRIPLSKARCDHRAWADAAKAAIAARGANLSTFTNFMFIFPPAPDCQWRGLGHLPGPHAWINGAPELRVTVHELGHNMGMHHANALRCTTNGVRVAISSTCTSAEYGDPFTTMGASKTRHDHNLGLLQIGYLPSSAAQTVVTGGTYRLVHPSATTGTRILGIPRGDGTWFYLEYRRPYGVLYDNFVTTDPAVKGVTIRMGSHWTNILQTQLIDTRPATETFDDAALRLDRTFRDPVSGIAVRVDSLGTTTARLSITMPADTTAPSAPTSLRTAAISSTTIDLAWAAATDNRAVSAYLVLRDGALIATLDAWTTTLHDAGLVASTTYAYEVRSVDAAGNEGAPATISVTTKRP